MPLPHVVGFSGMVPDPRVERFCESHSYDRRLYRHDIAGSIAHAQMLNKIGVLTADESAQIEQSLGRIEQMIDRGEMEFSASLEDIHMHIERALIDELGDVGRKLHTGRSRNDQVATDIRLWCRDAMDEVDALLANLQRAFLSRCDHDMGYCVAVLYASAARSACHRAAHLAGLL